MGRTCLEKHAPLTDPAYLSQLSHQLWEEISKLKLETDFYWTSLWEGDKSINPGSRAFDFGSASGVLWEDG